jgi:hypothetical protein
MGRATIRTREELITMARNTTPQPDPDDLRKDLLAALAASRELGSEMDSAIVDAHLRRHYGESTQHRKPAVVERRPLDLSPIMLPLSMLVGLVAFLAVLWFSHGMLWFLFWPLMAWGWWGRRRWGSYGRDWRGDRDARREARWRARHGYYLQGEDGVGRPSAGEII